MRPRTLSSLAVALLLMFALVGATDLLAKPKRPPSGKPAKPMITWSQPRVTLAANEQGAATVAVTVSSSVALDNVVLRLSGGLAPMVQVSPATLNLQANVPQTLTFSLLPGAATHPAGGVARLEVAGKPVGKPLQVKVRLPGQGGAETEDDVEDEQE